MGSVSSSHLTPLFVDASPGRRFCILHEPAALPCRMGVVYVHPFAEEMNKSRRMASLQSRRLAQAGCAVLQIDLYGCGDSEGDFSAATWEIWKRDVDLARQRLEHSHRVPIVLWGLRLGGLLAAEVFAQSVGQYAALLLWQPVTDGGIFVNQFLRLRVTNEMLSATAGRRLTTDDLRMQLSSGQPLDVAGYTLSPSLVQSIAASRIDQNAAAGTRVVWFEVIDEAASSASPAARRAAGLLEKQGVNVTLECVTGEPFWQTIEIAECPALLERTLDSVASLQ